MTDLAFVPENDVPSRFLENLELFMVGIVKLKS